MSAINPRKRGATGPVSAAGKARSALNATKHGALSPKVLLPGESHEDLERLTADIALALHPVGAMEHFLVQKIVAAMWRKQRLEQAEQTVLASVQMTAVTEEELRTVLGLPEGVRLPAWMLDESNAPSERAGRAAANKAHLQGWEDEPGLEQQRKLHDAKLKAAFAAALQRSDGMSEAERAAQQAQEKEERAEQEKLVWTAYWHRHRARIKAAFQTIRIKRMLAEWDLDHAHRYHTMLDKQLFRLLQEFRAMQSWRLEHLSIVGERAPGATLDEAPLVTEVPFLPVAKKAARRRTQDA